MKDGVVGITPDYYCGETPVRILLGTRNFSFIRKPLVRYLHLSFIVFKAFVVQINYILFTTLICRERAMIHTNVSKEKSPLDWPGSIYSNQ